MVEMDQTMFFRIKSCQILGSEPQEVSFSTSLTPIDLRFEDYKSTVTYDDSIPRFVETGTDIG